MNVFIDANVLLDFYRLSDGDLEEIRKISKLAEIEHIFLHLSDYLLDEFQRNREKTISLAAEQFRKSTINLHLPNLVRGYPEAEVLSNLRSKFNSEVKKLSDKLESDIRDRLLQADKIISELFGSVSVVVLDERIIANGILRSQLGRPPGKPNSIGDAIHWEWLLDVVPKKENLVLISSDGDFESPVVAGMPSTYILDEWKSRGKGDLVLYKSLTEFFKSEFPDIQLADEIEKASAIEKLCGSKNFATTHAMIAKLSKYEDFTKEETDKLLDGFLTNQQVSWILGDEDVKEFAMKLVQFAYDLELNDEAFPLEEMLNDLELDLI